MKSGDDTTICLDPLRNWPTSWPDIPWNEAGRSGSGGVEKDVEGLDSAAFNSGNIGSGHGRRTVRRTGLPAQPPETVMADGPADRGEDEVWLHGRAL